MRIFISLLFLTSRCLFAAEIKNRPLTIAAPEGWRTEYRADKKGNPVYYTYSNHLSPSIISISVLKGEPAERTKILDGIAAGFVKVAKTLPDMSEIDLDFGRGVIHGTEFAGEYVRFDSIAPGRRVVAIFLISNGRDLWKGDYSGRPEDWDEVCKMLSTLRTGDTAKSR